MAEDRADRDLLFEALAVHLGFLAPDGQQAVLPSVPVQAQTRPALRRSASGWSNGPSSPPNNARSWTPSPTSCSIGTEVTCGAALMSCVDSARSVASSNTSEPATATVT